MSNRQQETDLQASDCKCSLPSSVVVVLCDLAMKVRKLEGRNFVGNSVALKVR